MNENNEHSQDSERTRGLSRQSSELADELKGIIAKGVEPNEVTEQEFVETYLPQAILFHNKQPFDMGYWVGKAGSINNGLRVTNGMGEVLFETPPLVNMASVRVEAGFSDMITAGQDAVRQNKDRAFAESQFLTQDTVKLSAPDTSSRIIAWHGIFKRYGHNIVEVDEGGEVASNSTDDGAKVETAEVVKTPRGGVDEFL